MTPEKAGKLIAAHVAQLSEHFDAVQILASYPLDGGTQPITGGSGNWFARQGMAHDFIDTERAEQIARSISLAQ